MLNLDMCCDVCLRVAGRCLLIRSTCSAGGAKVIGNALASTHRKNISEYYSGFILGAVLYVFLFLFFGLVKAIVLNWCSCETLWRPKKSEHHQCTATRETEKCFHRAARGT